MARKKASAATLAGSPDASTSASTSTDAPTSVPSAVDTTLAQSAGNANAEEDVIKVNNSSLADLKNACDDAVKRFLSQPDQFTPNHTHTDVKLALGWSSVFVALGTAFYGWKIDFEKSKPVVWVGVILYVLLTTTSTLYSYFIEKDTVYVGKRKSLAKRIETERITVASRTNTSPGPSPKSSSTPAPTYVLSISYLRSANAGKSLIRQGTAKEERPYTDFFDGEGSMERGAFERWVGSVVEKVVEGK